MNLGSGESALLSLTMILILDGSVVIVNLVSYPGISETSILIPDVMFSQMPRLRCRHPLPFLPSFDLEKAPDHYHTISVCGLIIKVLVSLRAYVGMS